MSRLLRHRGPDDEGFFFAGADGVGWFGGPETPGPVIASDLAHVPRERLDRLREFGPGVLLGHRRLAIIDLTAHGHQPLMYRDRYWTVFNGEIYNYPELRQELEGEGHRFSGGSDTEVLLAAYDQWGPDFLTRANGMWALAILDLHRKTLFLARDRFGVKPLYLWGGPDRLVFASEIKAFSALSDWRARANVPRLLDYLVWNVSDHTEETMFEGVRQLPGGHHLVLNVAAALEGKQAVVPAQPQRWYSLPQRSAPELVDGAESLREALARAVELRLRADVPVGACLSGGVDSSSIVCLMSQSLQRAGAGDLLRTFTARSDDVRFDETEYASTVVAAAKSTPTYVTPTPRKLFEDLGSLIWHQDEPFVSSSIFAQWCVFEAAHQGGVIVMLDGQGADEVLCGYRGFFGAYLAGLLRAGRIASWWRECGAMRRVIGFGRARSLGYTAAYLAPSLLGLLGRLDNRAYADRGWLRKQHAHAFGTDPLRLAGARGSVRQMSHAQVTATNLPMLLHWEDRNSMAFSVEARVPFLDYRVVELGLALADSEKLGGGVSKAVLRRAMRGTVPDRVLDRRDKMGFVTAEPLWMTRDLAPQFRQDVAGAVEVLPGLLDRTLVDRFDEVQAGRRPFDHRYWRALCAGRWAKAFSVSVGS